MFENIIIFLLTIVEITFFAIGYIIEKSNCKDIADEQEATKILKRAKNTFYIWTDISIVLSILVILSVICIEWHMNFMIVFALYQILDFAICLKKTISSHPFNQTYFLKLFFPLIIFWGIYSYMSIQISSDLKPIIYIYPETETKVQVSVGYPEKLSCVYPEYDMEEGWEVIAKPNGDLIDTKTGRNLYCLYWEGNQKQDYKFKDGFVVAGEDSAKFLEEKLAILGLNEREVNEFIIYWLPKLEANKYNLIRFETAEEIEEYMPLNIEPKPDSLIRVSMNFKGLNKPIEIEEQNLEQVVREGYTVVEWGGSEF